ncbi:MAG: gamma-glutamyltransferase family protein [Gudongella sp.]|nr:gamma-glutamyltransferase family protein [Gudongella sp.]
MKFDPIKCNDNPQDGLVCSKKGMVATTNPYASQAGIEVMKSGGNAFDAAVAAAAALVVVEPTGCGLGSDAFAILHTEGSIFGLNGSGYSPRNLTSEHLHRLGLEEVPRFGPLPVMVPGAVASWKAILDRFGNLTLREVLQPAIELAQEGHIVQPVISGSWEKSLELQRKMGSEEYFLHWFNAFSLDGRAPGPGELWKNKDLAKTFRMIADSEGEDFYRGKLAERMVSFLRSAGGVMTMGDLAEFSPQWVQPLSVSYRGYDIWELPPNGQGITALLALSILENITEDSRDPVEIIHRSIEAMKLGFEDGIPLVGDPKFCKDNWSELLGSEYGRLRSADIGDLSRTSGSSLPSRGGTVYLAAADGEGNMISFIQSNYRGFGSGLVVPGTGISLNNRGFDFSMDNKSANFLQGRKRPYNTIIPAFMTKGGKAVGPFGLMGGYMQPQGHIQLLVNILEREMDPQGALDEPRWQWNGSMGISVERDFSEDIRKALGKRGHRIVESQDTSFFGRGQIIIRDQEGFLYGATEKRADSLISTW